MTDDRRIRPSRVLSGRDRHTITSALPWVAILIITGGFHLYREAVADGVIYLVVAGAVLLDAVGILRIERSARSWQLPRGLLLGCSSILAVPLMVSPLYGAMDTVVVAAIGVIVLILCWPAVPPTAVRPQERRARRRAAILWSCAGVVFCLWELSAYFLGRPSAAAQYAFPALSDLVDPIIQTIPGRIVLVALWFLGGIALVRRGRHS